MANPVMAAPSRRRPSAHAVRRWLSRALSKAGTAIAKTTTATDARTMTSQGEFARAVQDATGESRTRVSGGRSTGVGDVDSDVASRSIRSNVRSIRPAGGWLIAESSSPAIRSNVPVN